MRVTDNGPSLRQGGAPGWHRLAAEPLPQNQQHRAVRPGCASTAESCLILPRHAHDEGRCAARAACAAGIPTFPATGGCSHFYQFWWCADCAATAVTLLVMTLLRWSRLSASDVARRYVWAFQFCVMVGLPLTLAMGKVGDASLLPLVSPDTALHATSAAVDVILDVILKGTCRGHHQCCAQLWETRLVWTALLAVESVLTMLGSNAFLCGPDQLSESCSGSVDIHR